MSFGLCRDCSHWTPRTTLYIYNSIHYCAIAATRDGLTTTPTKAAAYDVEAYGADLITEPDFGCVQFQKIECDETNDDQVR